MQYFYVFVGELYNVEIHNLGPYQILELSSPRWWLRN